MGRWSAPAAARRVHVRVLEQAAQLGVVDGLADLRAFGIPYPVPHPWFVNDLVDEPSSVC